MMLNKTIFNEIFNEVEKFKVIDTKEDIRERWKIVEPSWEASRCTGYGCTLDIAI